MSPFTLSVKANSADTPNWFKVMNGPLAEGYWHAMEEEIKTLEAKESWEIVERKPHMKCCLPLGPSNVNGSHTDRFGS